MFSHRTPPPNINDMHWVTMINWLKLRYLSNITFNEGIRTGSQLYVSSDRVFICITIWNHYTYNTHSSANMCINNLGDCRTNPHLKLSKHNEKCCIYKYNFCEYDCCTCLVYCMFISF